MDPLSGSRRKGPTGQPEAPGHRPSRVAYSRGGISENHSKLMAWLAKFWRGRLGARPQRKEKLPPAVMMLKVPENSVGHHTLLRVLSSV